MERCDICPNACYIRKNSVCGRYQKFDENIIKTTAIAIDPIEKKPLYHYKPGSKTLSIGTLGCNLKCLNCQNHSIAQPSNLDNVPIRMVSPESIVNIALENKLNSISWTYNEPTIYPEWIIKTAKMAQDYDIETILVTNGYTSIKTLKNLVKYVDAVNVDLKSMSSKFYQKICGGKLEYVQNSIEFYYKNNVHTEVTTLLIPSYNDDKKSIENVCDYTYSISENIVMHFSAFYPQFKLKHLHPTDEKTVFKACEIAKEKGIKYVYPGNTYISSLDNTYCSNCGNILIKRDYYDVNIFITHNKCPNCNDLINDIVL